MPYIEFTALGDLLAFVTACHTRHEALGQRRDRRKYGTIHFDRGQTYSIAFAAEDWDYENPAGQFTYGGSVERAGNPKGTPLNLNEILRRLPLLGQASRTAPSALVLAVEDEGPDSLHKLHEAWREIPKLDGAESRFFVRSDSANIRWTAVEVREVSPRFDDEQLKAHREHGLKTFAPAWPSPSCYLYVETGYRYPKPEEFALLYDEQFHESADSGATSPTQLLLLSAGDRIVPARGKAAAEMHAPRWLRVKLHSHSLTEDLYNLTLQKGVALADTDAAELPESARLETPVIVGENRQVFGPIDEIERRIAVCSREMEELLTRKARLNQRRQSSWLATHTFDQAEGAPLPQKLKTFLARPLGELAQYRYVALRLTNNGRRHCVVGEIAQPWGSAVAVPCDITWLCDARWRDWSLPLFLRSDTALNVNVDEESLAAKVCELLDRIEGFPAVNAHSVILTEPADADGGLSLCPLESTQPLDEVLHFFNHAMGWVESQAEPIASAGELLVAQADQMTAGAALELDQILQERAGNLLRELETAWAATREAATATLFKLRVAEAGLHLGEQACVESSDSWEHFLNHALRIDERISRLKLASGRAWLAEAAERERRLESIRMAQRNFSEELRQSGDKLQEEREKLTAAWQQLEAARAAHGQEMASLLQMSADLDALHHATEQEMEEAKLARLQYEENSQRYAQHREDLKTFREKSEALQTELLEITADVNNSDTIRTERLQQLHDVAQQCMAFVATEWPQPLPPAEPEPAPPSTGGFFSKRRT